MQSQLPNSELTDRACKNSRGKQHCDTDINILKRMSRRLRRSSLYNFTKTKNLHVAGTIKL